MPRVKTSKEEVLKKVIPVLRSKGISNSSMSELAKACGIQKSHFYYYFSNKDQLIKEVLEMVHSYFRYNFYRILDSKSLSDLQKTEKIEALLYKMFQKADGGCIMANTALETANLNSIYKEDIQRFFTDFMSGLQKILEVKYDIIEASRLAEQIVQDIEGGILLMQVFNDPKYLNNAVSRMKKIILKE